jgi:hypothetical protein
VASASKCPFSSASTRAWHQPLPSNQGRQGKVGSAFTGPWFPFTWTPTYYQVISASGGFFVVTAAYIVEFSIFLWDLPMAIKVLSFLSACELLLCCIESGAL